MRNTDIQVEATRVGLGTRIREASNAHVLTSSVVLTALRWKKIYTKFKNGKFTVTTCVYLLAEVFIKAINVSAANLEGNSVSL